MHKKILIIGTNDIATACAVRLFRCGFPVTLISPAIPLDLYYFRNYSSVLVAGSKVIEGIKARSYADYLYNQTQTSAQALDSFVNFSMNNKQIAVLSSADFKKTSVRFDYGLVSDLSLFETLQINKTETTFICCIPGNHDFCNYNIITEGPYSGRVHYPFLDMENTSAQETFHRVTALREAVFVANKSPGDKVSKDESIGLLGDDDVLAGRDGFLAGCMRSGVIVSKNQILAHISMEKVKDLKELPLTTRAVSGAALEALLYDMHLNNTEI